MSIPFNDSDRGCLYTISGKKYIYTGTQKNTKGNMVHTFYGLDGIEPDETIDLTGIPLNKETFKNETLFDTTSGNRSSIKAAVDIVKSPIYGTYTKTYNKAELPKQLNSRFGKLLKNFKNPTFPSAIYIVADPYGTPKRYDNPDLGFIPNLLDYKPLQIYAYRIGENGPGLQNIKEGKINKIDEFINDYKKMKLTSEMKSFVPVPVNPMQQGNSMQPPSTIQPGVKPDLGRQPEIAVGYNDDDGQALRPPRGGRTKRKNKQRKSKTYKNKT
jgi:hypothetical protein